MADTQATVMKQLRDLVAIRRKQLELMHILIFEADEALQRIHDRHHLHGQYYGLNKNDCPELPNIVKALRVSPTAEIETIEDALKILREMRKEALNAAKNSGRNQ